MTFRCRALTPNRKYTWLGTYYHLVRESTRPVKNVMGIYTETSTQKNYSLSVSLLKRWKCWNNRTSGILLRFARIYTVLTGSETWHTWPLSVCFFMITSTKPWADLGNWVSTHVIHVRISVFPSNTVLISPGIVEILLLKRQYFVGGRGLCNVFGNCVIFFLTLFQFYITSTIFFLKTAPALFFTDYWGIV